MKMNRIVILLAVIAIIIGGWIWFKSPIDMMEVNSEEIMEIAIFDGNTGNSVNTFDKEDISHIIENFNTIKLKKKKLSSDYVGYSFKITIYGNDGQEIDGWNNFIINSKDTVRKDPFFYSVVDGSIDYEYLKDLIEKGIDNSQDVFYKIDEYMKEASIATFSKYYELLDFQISNYVEEVADSNVEATFFYKIIHKNYDKDPDTVGYIKEAKESGNKNYQQMYDEYLKPQEMNFDFKIVIDKNDKITLYSNVSPNGIEWEETKMSDYIIQK